MKDYTVYDGEQAVRFTGELLSAVSSNDQHKPRWTVTEIYKTEAGNYIVHKVGKSRIPNERELHSAQVSKTAEGCIECLRMYDADGVMAMRWTDKRALLEAMESDSELASAFREGISVA